MILDIASPKILLAVAVWTNASKLAEDLAQRLAHHVCQHVQPPCNEQRFLHDSMRLLILGQNGSAWAVSAGHGRNCSRCSSYRVVPLSSEETKEVAD